jgi:hypothetical protein
MSNSRSISSAQIDKGLIFDHGFLICHAALRRFSRFSLTHL